VVLPAREPLDPVTALRATLDRFDIGGRLLHIRDFVWRGGDLQFRVDVQHGVCYRLTAEWPAAVLDRTRPFVATAVESLAHPLVEGRWVRATRGYQLSVGIDVRVPSAISIRADGFSSAVPIVGRLEADVAERVHGELTAYVDRFLSRHATVPEAEAADRARLRQLGLD
jgi:hypothetical protein